jgi:hypothetical protein
MESHINTIWKNNNLYIMYNLAYYNYYKFSKYMKENTSSPLFYNTALEGVILLSSMEFFNLVTIGLWVKLPPLITTHLLDVTLAGIALLGANSFYFLRHKRYIKIVIDCDNSTPFIKKSSTVVIVLYSAISVGLIIAVRF